MTGRIYNAMTGEAIPAATVAVVDANGKYTGAGTVADGNGSYMLNVLTGTRVKVSSLGYNSLFTYATPNKNISLFPSSNALPEVTVTAPAPVYNQNNNMESNKPKTSGPNWTDLKPLLIGLAVIVAVGFGINQMHDNARKKPYKRKR